MQTKKTFKLSPSGLNLMRDCPRCFWLTENRVWRRPFGIFPSLPSGMDRILKNHFDKFMAQGLLPPELCNNSECENFQLFPDKELLREWRNSRKGLWYEDSEGNVLHGGVDNIMVNKTNKKLIILDYKTRGFPLKEDTHEKYQDQINIYSWLLEKMGFPTENFGYLLFYYPKEVTGTGEVIFDTTLKKMHVHPKDAEVLFEKALNLLNGNCPSGGCEWCQRF